MASELPSEQSAEAHATDEALQTSNTSQTLTVIEETGDLFEAPDRAVLIHACNCLGRWGSGIAREFKTRYPRAYAAYKAHCKKHSPSDLVGTALLLPQSELSGPKHRVGCVFTSKGFGTNKDAVSDILRATRTAMAELLDAICKDGDIMEIRICKINSGAFGVPWERTKRVLEGLKRNTAPMLQELRVFTPAPQRRKGTVRWSGRNRARIQQ